MMRNSLQKQEKERGSRGCSPWVASPLWGREGVTLIGFFKKISQ